MLQKATPFFNVGANQTATLKIESLNTINRIQLLLGGTFTKAQITDIRIKLGSLLVWNGSGSQIDAINKYRGLYDDATHLTLDFTEPKAKTIQGQLIGAYDLKTINMPLFLEVDIGGATNPTLQAFVDITAAQGNDLIQHMIKSTFSPAAAGEYLLPLDARGGNVERIHLMHTNVTDIKVRRGGYTLMDGPIGVFQFAQREFEKVPQAGHFCVDFIVDNLVSNALRTRNEQGQSEEVELYITLSAADTIVALQETLNRPR